MNTEYHFHSEGSSDHLYRHLEHIPLGESITTVTNRSQAELEKVAEDAAEVLGHLNSTYPAGSSVLEVFEQQQNHFFHSLWLHLENEVRDVFFPLGKAGILPEQETIHRMRVEHNQLLEALDVMGGTLENLQSEDAKQLAVIKQARDCVACLDAMLNAEILAEEKGIFRRFRPLQRFLDADQGYLSKEELYFGK